MCNLGFRPYRKTGVARIAVEMEQNSLPGVVLLETRAGRYANLEGLSLWRNAEGQLVASMISDDNFSPWLTTQLVEFILPD